MSRLKSPIAGIVVLHPRSISTAASMLARSPLSYVCHGLPAALVTAVGGVPGKLERDRASARGVPKPQRRGNCSFPGAQSRSRSTTYSRARYGVIGDAVEEVVLALPSAAGRIRSAHVVGR